MRMLAAALLLIGCAGTRYICRSLCMEKWKQCTSGQNWTNAVEQAECDQQKEACLDCCRNGGGDCSSNQ